MLLFPPQKEVAQYRERSIDPKMLLKTFARDPQAPPQPSCPGMGQSGPEED